MPPLIHLTTSQKLLPCEHCLLDQFLAHCFNLFCIITLRKSTQLDNPIIVRYLKSGILLLTIAGNSAAALTLPSSPVTMSRKRIREHSTSPKFHRVTWAEKRTGQGPILAAQVIPQSSPETPIKQRKHTTLQNTGYSRDQTPISGETIKEAMSLPPIPAPEILASKKGQRGKV